MLNLDKKDVLPLDIIESVLNTSLVNHSRWPKGKIVIHVSDLIKASTNNEFCPREYVLSFFDEKERRVRSLTPGQKLLFTTGEAVHRYIRDAWIENSPYGKYAWGVWECTCKDLRVTGLRPKRAPICKQCGTRAINYEEYSVYSPKYRIVGHPDFIIYYKGVYYIYEVKTIDRQDVNFDTMKHALGDHTLQGSCYYWLLRAEGKKVYPKVRYLYVDRNLRKMFGGKVYQEFEEKVSQKSRMQPLLNKAEMVIRSIDKRVLPPRICDEEECARAKNCRVAVACWNRRKGTV